MRSEQGRLVVVATPIGNLDDLSPRAAQELRSADVVACEDTRRTATLLRHVGSQAPMVANHAHNEAGRVADLLARVAGGASVVLVSDAGMPVISDPGARLVDAAIEAGVPVVVIPGPSAVETALVASGLPAEQYAFLGFFPRKTAQRLEVFEQWAQFPGSLVGFESPHRVGALLADLASVAPERLVAVCRELTKLHEQVLRGPARELADLLSDGARGEVTVVIGPGEPAGHHRDTQADIAVLLGAGLTPKDAADVSAKLGLAPRNVAYRAALAVPKRRST